VISVRRLLPTLGVFIVAAVVVLAVEPLRTAVGHALHGDVGALQAQLQALGVVGAIVLVGLILVHSVVLFPSEIVNATAGLVFGFLLGLPLVMVAWVISGLLAYWIGYSLGRPVAVKLVSEQRVATAERVIDRGGSTALVLSRLVPFVPYSLVGYVAGATRVPLWRYTWTSFVGILPITAAATYLGHALDNLSAGDPLLWVAVVVFVGLALLTTYAARHWHRSAK
jgi:uncharacterized membrane protein YdjX (TVP38/TMEM64 family)